MVAKLASSGTPRDTLFSWTILVAKFSTQDGKLLGYDPAYDLAVLKEYDICRTFFHPGNTGGPLIDSYGHLIGVNTDTFTSKGSGISSGVNFALQLCMWDLCEQQTLYIVNLTRVLTATLITAFVTYMVPVGSVGVKKLYRVSIRLKIL
ncbi:hypothetical protein EJB05_00313, partial [Eragrostis curvula]